MNGRYYHPTECSLRLIFPITSVTYFWFSDCIGSQECSCSVPKGVAVIDLGTKATIVYLIYLCKIFLSHSSPKKRSKAAYIVKRLFLKAKNSNYTYIGKESNIALNKINTKNTFIKNRPLKGQSVINKQDDKKQTT